MMTLDSIYRMIYRMIVTASPRAIAHNQHIVERMLHLSVAGVEAFCKRQAGDMVEVAGGIITPQIWVNVAGM